MHEEAECIDANSTGQAFLARAKYRAWTQDDIGQTTRSPIFFDQFFLFELAKGVRVETLLRRIFKRTTFIKQGATFQMQVRINSKRADTNKALWTAVF